MALGISTACKLSHPANADSGTASNNGRFTDVSALHSRNALLLIELTLVNTILVKVVQYAKACAPIDVTFGKLTVANE